MLFVLGSMICAQPYQMYDLLQKSLLDIVAVMRDSLKAFLLKTLDASCVFCLKDCIEFTLSLIVTIAFRGRSGR